MTFKCNTCEFVASTKEQLAGHRSGHARRGEILKSVRVLKGVQLLCQKCGMRFRKSSMGHRCRADLPYDSLVISQKRHRVLEEAKYACELCGFNQVRTSGKHVVQIDHIDGDNSNNQRENLRVLCPNCHALHSEHFMFYGRKHTGDMKRFDTSSRRSIG